MMKNKNNTIVNLALTGLMGALVYVATMFFKVEIPVGADRTMIGFANVFCVLSGLILGPAYGGLAAGLGSFLFDLTGGWFSSAGVTLITKGLMAVICGLIAWGGKQENPKFSRLAVAAVTGSLAYCVMYLGYSFFKLVVAGSAPEAAAIAMMTKAGATLLNAAVADVIAVPLFMTLRTALQRNHLWKGGKPGAAV
ncbi:MAG TPA: ECF transporter S component [Candidatus Gallacutalibacter pullistercoris]|nr:ECF transporter S component [Candidatus Gallacutalibacter pullistercoris]